MSQRSKEQAEAELETINRAIAIALEQQKNLKTQQDNELKIAYKKKLAQLNRELGTLRNEVKETQGIVLAAQKTYKKELTEHQNTLETLANMLETLNTEKAVLEETNVALTKENRDLASGIKVANQRLEELNTAYTKLLAEITLKNEQDAELGVRNTEMLAATRILEEDMQALGDKISKDTEDFNLKKATLERNIQIMTARLAEIQKTEKDIREYMAEKQIALDQREKTINTREEAVTLQEQRVYRYAKFSGIEL